MSKLLLIFNYCKKSSLILIMVCAVIGLSLFLFLKIFSVGFHPSTVYEAENFVVDENESYIIRCRELYWLTYRNAHTKNEISGIAIASSPNRLVNFCDKSVKVRAKQRKNYDSPLCPQITDLSWCKNLKTPVVDIFEIQLEEVK